jgi:hypothetical protein
MVRPRAVVAVKRSARAIEVELISCVSGAALKPRRVLLPSPGLRSALAVVRPRGPESRCRRRRSRRTWDPRRRPRRATPHDPVLFAGRAALVRQGFRLAEQLNLRSRWQARNSRRRAGCSRFAIVKCVDRARASMHQQRCDSDLASRAGRVASCLSDDRRRGLGSCKATLGSPTCWCTSRPFRCR